MNNSNSQLYHSFPFVSTYMHLSGRDPYVKKEIILDTCPYVKYRCRPNQSETKNVFELLLVEER